MNSSAEEQGYESLRCMEIWGGIEPVETARTTPGLQFWLYSRPYEGAGEGGDVHYLTLCGGGFITRIAVADVSGHGMAVSDFSSKLRALLRKHINHKSQRALVARLNEEFGQEAQLRRFATAIIATYLTSNDELTICNAGHPRPLHFSADDRRWSILKGDSTVVGRESVNLPLGLDDETRYDQFTITLRRGDFVVFYTDALIEAADERGSVLGEAGLLELARSVETSDRDPRTVGMRLREAVAEYRGHRPPDDDLTLLVLHHTADPTPRLSVSEKLDVYLKFFGLKSV